MKLFAAIIVLCCIGATRLQAQINIEGISTDTVDLFNKPPVTSEKPSSFSLLSTLILPGSAHQSIGRPKSALGFISLDAVSLFSAIFFYRTAAKTTENAKAFAALYANAPAGVDDNYFWKMVGSFDNYTDFHETMRLIRDPDDKFNAETYFWKWDDKSSREEFITMQKNANRYITVSSFFIGAMVLNRIIAFIDMRTALKDNRYNKNASISVTPYISDCSARGLMVRSEF